MFTLYTGGGNYVPVGVRNQYLPTPQDTLRC